ncbi:structural protein [Pseudomonas sp. 3JA]|uniref:structural protein n=1 Tax=Pseudomonas sp. 3JA TaxID=3109347 RepID=UPI0030096AFC
MSIPRGIRNNNPGNIDYNPKTKWVGQLPHDPAIEPRFCRFDRPENGIRALAKTLLTYSRKHGLNTAAAIIGRWAPASENNTAAYVRSVESALWAKGLGRSGPLDLQTPAILGCLVRSIMRHENGGYPYEESLVDDGVQRALA